MNRKFVEVLSMRKVAAMTLAVGVAVGLTGCIGGGSSGGGVNPTNTIPTSGDDVGWGYKFDSGSEVSPVAEYTLKVTRNKQGQVTQVVVGSGANATTVDCTGKLSVDTCVGASGQEVYVTGTNSSKGGYSYLSWLEWEQKPQQLVKTRGDVTLIGGRASDRTKKMPTQGTATYKGEVSTYFATPGNMAFDGKVTLTANFQKGTVSGRLDNFTRDDGTGAKPVNGRLDLKNGKITGNSMSASLSGNVGADTIDQARTHMNGGFFGPNAEEVGGGIAGRSTSGKVFGALWRAKKQ